MINARDKEDIRTQFLGDVTNNRAVFLFGAGVSMVQPTGLPSGKEIKELLVDNIAYRPDQKLFLEKLNRNTHYQNIIPEVLFQEIFSIIGDKIYDIYQILRIADPNRVHMAIAGLSAAFDIPLYTTNFDELVDRYMACPENICHLHGHLGNPGEMGILITQIGLGVSSEFQRQFLRQTKGKILYVFGYSGNDKDVIDLINKSDLDHVIWLMRDVSNKWEQNNLRGIRNKEIYCFQDELSAFFDHISQTLKLGVSEPPAPQGDHVQRNKIIADFKKEITLYESYGCLDLLFYINSDYDQAIEVCKKALTTQHLMKENEILKTLISLADNMRTLGKNLPEALDISLAGLNRPNICDYPMEQANLLNIQGLILYELNKPLAEILQPYLSAEQVTKHYLSILRNRKQSVGAANDLLSRIYNNIGIAYRELGGDVAESERYHKKAAALKHRIGHIIGICRTYSYLCLVALHLGNKRKFRNRLKQTLEIISKYDLFRIEYQLYHKIGEYLCEKGETKKGLRWLERGLEVCSAKMYSETADIKRITDLVHLYTAHLFNSSAITSDAFLR